MLEKIGAYAAGELEGEEAREAERLIFERPTTGAWPSPTPGCSSMLATFGGETVEVPRGGARLRPQAGLRLGLFAPAPKTFLGGLGRSYVDAFVYYFGLRPGAGAARATEEGSGVERDDRPSGRRWPSSSRGSSAPWWCCSRPSSSRCSSSACSPASWRAIGLDDLFDRTGAANSLWQLGYEGGPSRLLGTVLFWGIILTGVAAALSVLGLSSLESTMDQIVNLSGRAPGGARHPHSRHHERRLAGGARRPRGRARRAARPNAFRRVVFATVLAVAAL